MATVILRPGREASLERRHPWLFSGAIQEVQGAPGAGDTVEVLAADGRWLARGAYSPHSQIAVRVWTFDPEESVDGAWFRGRLDRAVRARAALAARSELDAYRLVYGESDGIPGLIVDRYADFLVCQFLTAGVERWRREIVEALASLGGYAGVYERSDVAVRTLEGLDERRGLLAGSEPPPLIEIREGAARFLVDVREGQKTGFYLDQREHRALAAGEARDAEVLNGFAYTGSFGIAALLGGARFVTNVETSREALALAQRQAALNGLETARFECLTGDAFQILRGFRDAGRSFDLVVLDPPKFAESRSQVPRAARAYKDINLLAFKLLRRSGRLLTFSCSGHVKPDLFQKIVADAALDAGREAQVLRVLGQPEDHPVGLAVPETAYLKGLLVRVL